MKTEIKFRISKRDACARPHLVPRGAYVAGVPRRTAGVGAHYCKTRLTLRDDDM